MIRFASWYSNLHAVIYFQMPLGITSSVAPIVTQPGSNPLPGGDGSAEIFTAQPQGLGSMPNDVITTQPSLNKHTNRENGKSKCCGSGCNSGGPTYYSDDTCCCCCFCGCDCGANHSCCCLCDDGGCYHHCLHEPIADSCNACCHVICDCVRCHSCRCCDGLSDNCNSTCPSCKSCTDQLCHCNLCCYSDVNDGNCWEHCSCEGCCGENGTCGDGGGCDGCGGLGECCQCCCECLCGCLGAVGECAGGCDV